VVVCLQRGAVFAYGPADATATPSVLAPVKSRMVYLSGDGLPRLSWKKRLLNGCSRTSSHAQLPEFSTNECSAVLNMDYNYLRTKPAVSCSRLPD